MQSKTLKLLYLAGLVVGGLIRWSYTRKSGQDESRGNEQAKAVIKQEGYVVFLLMILWGIGSQFVPLFYTFTHKLNFADYHLPRWAEKSLGCSGVATFVFGLWLLWRSHADLGESWSPTTEIKEDHQLVTNGVYRYIRHPMYTAHLLWGIAQAMLLQNWIAGLSSLVTLIPLYMLRIPREEHMMLDEFGEEYRSYMARTGRFNPRI